MFGYKVFDKNFQCQGYQFELGKTHVHDGPIELCKSGFHFCLNAKDCFSYYDFDTNNIVCEIEADNVSEQTKEDSKRVCGKLTVTKRLTWEEVLSLVNIGKNNTGLGNSGNFNSGHYNSGNFNSGHYNSGNFNSGYYNSGLFNVDEPSCRIFGKDSGLTYTQLLKNNMVPFINLMLRDTNGKQIDYKVAWANWWNNANNEKEKRKILALPNFDANIFEEITGIKTSEIK